MLVKDLYYQKYLKYKTKYLNLLSQTGGALLFITETEGNTITINNKESVGSRAFSVEELNKPGITTIKLENVMEYSDIVHILTAQDFSNINTLIFDGNDLSTIDNVNLIVSIIKLFKNVLNLKFNKNNIDDKGAEALAELLKVNSTIEILNLNENNIGNKGINALAEALKKNTTVKQLYLKKNIFNTEGTAALGKALYENEKIENLYITMGSNKNDSESDLRTHFKTIKKELQPLVI
jgi:Ran GTPase-activating protein (RanGAP) involved in mRNA processing and transport